jgi:hypothetical protein
MPAGGIVGACDETLPSPGRKIGSYPTPTCRRTWPDGSDEVINAVDSFKRLEAVRGRVSSQIQDKP